MAGKRGAAAKGSARPNNVGSNDGGTQIVTLSLSLPQKMATRIGRVKRWEDRSRDTTLELTGRR